MSKSKALMKAIAARGIGERYLVTRIARQHRAKRAYKRKEFLPSWRDGVSPKLLLLFDRFYVARLRLRSALQDCVRIGIWNLFFKDSYWFGILKFGISFF